MLVCASVCNFMCVAADHFGLEISQVVKSNLQLFETDPSTTFKYQTTLTPDEMKQTLQAVVYAASKPWTHWWHH